MRYCLVQDEDCYWYLIPAQDRKLFMALCDESYGTDNFDDFDDRFGNLRVDGPHSLTFTDPKED